MINTFNNINQQTISNPIIISGIGLHSGVEVSMKLIPAEADFGIKFYRTDLTSNNEVEAIWSNVSNTELSTTISNRFRNKCLNYRTFNELFIRIAHR